MAYRVEQQKPKRTLLFQGTALATPERTSSAVASPINSAQSPLRSVTAGAPTTPPPRLSATAVINSVPLQAAMAYQPHSYSPAPQPSAAARTYPTAATFSNNIAERIRAADINAAAAANTANAGRNSTSYHSVYSDNNDNEAGNTAGSFSVIHTSSRTPTSASTRYEIIRSTTGTATSATTRTPFQFSHSSEHSASLSTVGEVLVFSQEAAAAPAHVESLSLSQQLLLDSTYQQGGGASPRPTTLPYSHDQAAHRTSGASPRPSGGQFTMTPVTQQMPANPLLVGTTMPHMAEQYLDEIATSRPPLLPSAASSSGHTKLDRSYPPHWFNLYYGVPDALSQVQSNNNDAQPVWTVGPCERNPIPPATPSYEYMNSLRNLNPNAPNVFSIPFPFQPYNLQQNAMNYLRASLEAHNRYVTGGTTATAAKNIAEERLRRFAKEKAELAAKERRQRERGRNGLNPQGAAAPATARGEYSQSESQVDAYGPPDNLFNRRPQINPQQHRQNHHDDGNQRGRNNNNNNDDNINSDSEGTNSNDSVSDDDNYLDDITEHDKVMAVESLANKGLCGVTVLEAPTGTGKTHVLLNGVLSWLSLQRFKGAVARRQLLMQEREAVFKAIGHRRPQPPDDEGDVSWRNSDAVRNAKRRRKAKKGGAPNSGSSLTGGGNDTDDAFAPTDREAPVNRLRVAAALLGSTFHDSSDSDNANPRDKDEDEAAELPFNASEHYNMLFGSSEEDCLRRLGCQENATQIPLVKPKVWFTSRTHTQLAQCAEEMLKTEFGLAAGSTTGAAFNPYCVPPETSAAFVDFLRNPKDPLFRPLSDLDHQVAISNNTFVSTSSLAAPLPPTTTEPITQATDPSSAAGVSQVGLGKMDKFANLNPSALFVDESVVKAATILVPRGEVPSCTQEGSMPARPALNFARHQTSVQVPNAPPAAHTPIMPLSFVHVGSRNMLCINKAIRDRASGNSDINELCKDAVAKERDIMLEAKRKLASGEHSCAPRGGVLIADIEDVYNATKREKGVSGCDACPYARYDKLLLLRKAMRARGSQDIEEVQKLGVELGACPFLASRQMARAADVVFVHFNYIVDPLMRTNLMQLEPIADESAKQINDHKKAVSVRGQRNDRDEDPFHPSRIFTSLVASSCYAPSSVQGDVVIFDEGHNVVDVARAVLRADISYTQLRRAKNAFVLYLDKYGRFMGLKAQHAYRTLISFTQKLQKYLRKAQRAFHSKQLLDQLAPNPALPCSPSTLAELRQPLPRPGSIYTDIKYPRYQGEGNFDSYHAMGGKQVVREERFSSFTFAAEIESMNLKGVEDVAMNGESLRKIKGCAKGASHQLAKLAIAFPDDISLDGFGSPFFEDNRRHVLFKQTAAAAMAAGGDGSGGEHNSTAQRSRRNGRDAGIAQDSRISQWKFWKKYDAEKAAKHAAATTTATGQRRHIVPNTQPAAQTARNDAEDTDDGEDYERPQQLLDEFVYVSRGNGNSDDSDDDHHGQNMRRIGRIGGAQMPNGGRQGSHGKIAKEDRQKGKETYAEFRARQEFVEAAYREDGFSEVDDSFASEPVVDPYRGETRQNVGAVRPRDENGRATRVRNCKARDFLTPAERAVFDAKAFRTRIFCHKYDAESKMQDPRTNSGNLTATMNPSAVDQWAHSDAMATTRAITVFLDVLRKLELATESTIMLTTRNDEVIASPGPAGKKMIGAAKRKMLPPSTLSMCVFPVDASAVMRPLQDQCRHVITAGGTLHPTKITVEPIFPLGTFVYNPFGHIVDAKKALRVCTLGATPSNPSTRFHFVFARAEQRQAMNRQGCELLLQLCPIIPEGLVVFFASYEKMSDFWKAMKTEIVPNDFIFTRELLNPGAVNAGFAQMASAYPYDPPKRVQGLTYYEAIRQFKAIFTEIKGGKTEEVFSEYKSYIENNYWPETSKSPGGSKNLASQNPSLGSAVGGIGTQQWDRSRNSIDEASTRGRRTELRGTGGAQLTNDDLDDTERIVRPTLPEDIRAQNSNPKHQAHRPTQVFSRKGTKHKHHRGAIITCVLSGKLSEGINFNDHFGRGVVVFGMQAPNPFDAEVDLTLTAIADGTARGGGGDRGSGVSETVNPYELPSVQCATESLETMKQLRDLGQGGTRQCELGRPPLNEYRRGLPATQFMSASAFVLPAEHSGMRTLSDEKRSLKDANTMKSVNQAIGRCIRHINDHAVIILCDERYQQPQIRSRLPAWMKESTKDYDCFDTVAAELETFFEDREREVPTSA